MAALVKWANLICQRTPSPPLRFPTRGVDRISRFQILKEEPFEEFKKGHYYAANVGNILGSKYQIVGKLGFGVTFTVELAHNLEGHRYVTLKLYTQDERNTEEFEIYKLLNKGNISHPGYPHMRTALDRFAIAHHGNYHHCLVQKPMWGSFRDLLYRNPTHRFTEALLKVGLKQVFLALDYLHTECKLVHTGTNLLYKAALPDIKSGNILQEIEDTSILDSFSRTEMEHPRPGHLLRYAGCSAWQFSVTTVQLYKERERNHIAQPNVYRAPEVTLKLEWSYPIYIWNVGVMDLFEGKHLFDGDYPDGKGYSTRAHIAEVIGILGLPPLALVRCGMRTPEFFTEDEASLQNSEEFPSRRNKEMFLEFIMGLLQWKPEDRKTAKELLQDLWLNDRSI
ncbi:hypothetical protein N7472_005329 [Penicillium cf. griseofulvum]|uniref:Protein kinase domain-containing protein n=1 Tax=Penicillium cf. griseofulvum TaxID=2972120 RepID=A0A9W9MF21_9EURO|nr:hypothetical protein N7472_005329 [Penicillium cf. griseofulvum]